MTSPSDATYVTREDGKVAVLISPGFGAGWSTWDHDGTNCLYEPEVVSAVLEGRRDNIPDMAKRLFGDGFYAGGACDLQVKWLDAGQRFRVDEYDGSESLVLLDPEQYHVVPGGER